MSKQSFTTGEVAKLCGVSVRTVQYYDTRGILVPTTLTEGGRRLYSEKDLEKMKIICFLREIGLPINSIGELLSEKDPASVISLLLEEQEMSLREEVKEREEKLALLSGLRRGLKEVEHFSVESIGDIAYTMENKKKLKKVRAVMILVGLVADAIEIGTLILGIVKGIWLPFIIGLPIVIALCVWVSAFYLKYTAYICPACHKVFKPRVVEAIFAGHTPNTRKLTCPHCGHKGFCVETYGEK